MGLVGKKNSPESSRRIAKEKRNQSYRIRSVIQFRLKKE